MPSEEFSRLLFVYLYKDKATLQAHLSRDIQDGCRKEDNKQAALSTYEVLDATFRRMADKVVDTTGMNIDQVADDVRRLSQANE